MAAIERPGHCNVMARVKPWRDRLRIAWWVLSGQEFTLRVDFDRIEVRPTPEAK
jgi:hypothetical protein